MSQTLLLVALIFLVGLGVALLYGYQILPRKKKREPKSGQKGIGNIVKNALIAACKNNPARTPDNQPAVWIHDLGILVDGSWKIEVLKYTDYHNRYFKYILYVFIGKEMSLRAYSPESSSNYETKENPTSREVVDFMDFMTRFVRDHKL